MKSNELIRMSGLIAIINGVLLLGFGILPDIFLPTKEPLLNWVNDSHWFILNISAFILTVFTPLSFLGIYAKQVEKVGKLGLFGFIFIYLGGMLYVGVQFDETFTWPILAQHAPFLIDIKGPMFTDPAFSLAYMLMAIVFIPGLIMLCIATIRAGVLPKLGAICLAIGSPFAYGGIMVPQILRTSGAVIGAIGFIWLGFALFNEKNNPTEQ